MSLTATFTLPASDLRTAATAGCSRVLFGIARQRVVEGPCSPLARRRSTATSVFQGVASTNGRPPRSLRSLPPDGTISALRAAGRALMVHLLNLLAAIALLVWGTHIVRTGVLSVAGESLRKWLA
jgi:hypothetical protein